MIPLQGLSRGLKLHLKLSRSVLIASATVLILCGTQSQVRAVETVTAQFLGNNGAFNGALGGSGFNNYAAQSFTAQVSGTLSKIAFQTADGGQSIPVSFAILNMAGGVPNAVLAEVQLPGSTVPDGYTLFAVDFSSFGIPIVAGNQYAITAKPAIDTTAFSPGWQFATGNFYSGGRAFWYPIGGPWDPNSTFITSDYDFGFQVTVVPENSTLSLFALAAACGIARRARRKAGGR
jgi:hypothetical protein